jgi:hypothetical protein
MGGALVAIAIRGISACQAQEPDLPLKNMALVQVDMEVRVTTVFRLSDGPKRKEHRSRVLEMSPRYT